QPRGEGQESSGTTKTTRITKELWSGSYADRRHLRADIRLDRSRGRQIPVAAGRVAFTKLRDAPAEQRTGLSGGEAEDRVVVGDRVVPLPQLEIRERAAVERRGVTGPQPQRRVAVGKRLRRVADDGELVAAAVESARVLRIEADGLAEIRDRPIVLSLAAVGVAAAVERARVAR